MAFVIVVETEKESDVRTLNRSREDHHCEKVVVEVKSASVLEYYVRSKGEWKGTCYPSQVRVQHCLLFTKNDDCIANSNDAYHGLNQDLLDTRSYCRNEDETLPPKQT